MTSRIVERSHVARGSRLPRRSPSLYLDHSNSLTHPHTTALSPADGTVSSICNYENKMSALHNESMRCFFAYTQRWTTGLLKRQVKNLTVKHDGNPKSLVTEPSVIKLVEFMTL